MKHPKSDQRKKRRMVGGKVMIVAKQMTKLLESITLPFPKYEAKITFLFALCDSYLDTQKVRILLHV